MSVELNNKMSAKLTVSSPQVSVSIQGGIIYICLKSFISLRVQELCKSRGGRPGLSVLISLTVSVDAKQY